MKFAIASLDTKIPEKEILVQVRLREDEEALYLEVYTGDLVNARPWTPLLRLDSGGTLHPNRGTLWNNRGFKVKDWKGDPWIEMKEW